MLQDQNKQLFFPSDFLFVTFTKQKSHTPWQHFQELYSLKFIREKYWYEQNIKLFTRSSPGTLSLSDQIYKYKAFVEQLN